MDLWSVVCDAMSGGLFVWAGGRWRALDACSGRVAGWPRPARFVYRARGHLRLASSAAVLRALRAFLAGQRSAVHDGPAVPRRRSELHLSRLAIISVCPPKNKQTNLWRILKMPLKSDVDIKIPAKTHFRTITTMF